MNFIVGQIKAFSFLFCTACDMKMTTGGACYIQTGDCYIQSDRKITRKKRTDSSNMFKCSGKVGKGGEC